MAASFDAIVIGAGSNGLVAAAALGRAKMRTLLLEQRDAIGGQARLLEFAPGFRGAPLGMNADWVPPAVIRGLGLQLDRVDADASVSVAVEPGQFLTLWRDPARAAEAIRPYSAHDAGAWPSFVTRLHKLAGFLSSLYQIPAPDIDTTAPGELMALLGVGRKLRGLGRADMTEFLRLMPMSIQELVDDTFENTPLKAAVAAGGIRNIRQGPRSGGTTFVLLHSLVGAPLGAVRSTAWWRTGPNAFVNAVEQVAQRHKVTVRLNAAVAHITIKDDAVTGVVLENGEEISAPRVLSTADPARTLLGMVDPVWFDPEFLHAVRNIKFRGCTAAVLYALDALPECQGLSNDVLNGSVSLTPNPVALERAADAAKYGDNSDQPHITLSVPSLRWPNSKLASTGKHVMLATAQFAPYQLRAGAWDEARREALADRVTATIESVSKCFTTRIVQRVALTPRDVERQYGLTEGAVTHGELMLDQILYMRPVPGSGHYAMPVRGLYLGGAGTHPGPDILGGPGWLAAARVLRDQPKK
jgi:phytoene dehydrogenase-like protein